jgi:hypothetical protein
MARKSRKIPRKSIYVLLAALLILTAALFAFHRPNKGSGVIPSSAVKQTSGSSDKQPSAQASPDKSTASGGQTVPSETVLLSPSGNFVSNHHPNLGGSPAPSAEQSVCNSTPGATCRIVFTKGDITKTLAAQTTDNNGATYWNWDVKDAGFTEGTWQITVTADINGQSKTATDSQDLVVQP